MKHPYSDIAHCDATAFFATSEPTDECEIHAQARVTVAALQQTLHALTDSGIENAVPMALLLYVQSKELQTLQYFFPIITQLRGQRRQRWLHWYAQLLIHTPVDIAFIRNDRHPAPLALRCMVVGQLVSCFVDRPDVLAAFVTTAPSFWLCADERSYQRVGGIGGGCYVDTEHRILLIADRLFEGYRAAIPGVCPLLHELGHMLDGTNRRLRAEVFCRGDFPLMTRAHQSAWRRAKRDEVQQYEQYRTNSAIIGRAPLGHPYVFQTDGEFLAGYWEMFWRNPNAFARTAPELYLALTQYVNHDPRAYTTDYRGYVEGNAAFYARGERAWPSDIRIDESL